MPTPMLFMQFYGSVPAEVRDEMVTTLRAAGIEAQVMADPVRQPRTGSGGAHFLDADLVLQHADAIVTGLVTSAVWAALALAFFGVRKWFAGVMLKIHGAHGRVEVVYQLPLDDADKLRKLLESIPADFDVTVASYSEHIEPSGETWRTWHSVVRRAPTDLPPDWRSQKRPDAKDPPTA
jgi:hypothetical protein